MKQNLNWYDFHLYYLHSSSYELNSYQKGLPKCLLKTDELHKQFFVQAIGQFRLLALSDLVQLFFRRTGNIICLETPWRESLLCGWTFKYYKWRFYRIYFLQIKRLNQILYILILQIMSEARKNEILEDFRRPNAGKSSRSRDLKERFHLIRSKETFLTDTQTSDYTKSSGEINSPRVQHLKELIRKLQRENAQLRQRVIDLKATQCFEVNEEKLKSMIMQNDHLRDQLENTKKQLQKSLVERDFLQRFNKNLKVQCESLTKEILVLKASSKCESKKIEKNIYTSRDERQFDKSRNSSKDSVLSKKKQFLNVRKEKEQKQKQSSGTLKTCLSASRLHQDYYGGRTSRQRPFRQH